MGAAKTKYFSQSLRFIEKLSKHQPGISANKDKNKLKIDKLPFFSVYFSFWGEEECQEDDARKRSRICVLYYETGGKKDVKVVVYSINTH